ncbi:MAG: hypothetical protein M1837_005531 [Sclerophora amabilis]|nr:MAG: hypothetical protein M1837_005531 [Sclerophora amabilis]
MSFSAPVLARMLRAKWNPPASPTASFASKAVIVTGSNVGLGFEAACKYVELGAASVVLAVRSVQKGEDAKNAIEARTGRRGVLKVMELDMGRYDSITAFADRVKKEMNRVDVALLNAGVISSSYNRSAEGWEDTLQVNTISTALLAMLLLPKLKASKISSSTPHLTIVTSSTHSGVDLSETERLHPLQSFSSDASPYDSQMQYAKSKLLAMHVTKKLAALALGPNGEPDVIVNDTCPGFCKSALVRGYDRGIMKFVVQLFYAIFAKTTEEGSRTLVHATLQGKESHGKWWRDDRITIPSEWVAGDEGKKVQEVVWQEIIEALEPKVPEAPFTSLRRIAPRWYSSTAEPTKGGEGEASEGDKPHTEQAKKEVGKAADPQAAELETKNKEIIELKDKYLRSVADFRNLQDRTKREVQSAKDFAIQRFAKDLVDSIDNLDRALGTVPADRLVPNEDSPPTKDLISLYDGLRMTETILMQTLKKHGLERFDPSEGDGEKFDPNLHEATFQTPMEGKDDGTVFLTQQKGFVLNGRVLRAAKVGVVKNA